MRLLIIKKLRRYWLDYQKAICICCKPDGSLSRIERMLNDENVSSARVTSYEEILNQKTVMKPVILPIENGFDMEKITFFAEKDITGKTFKEQKKRKPTTAKIFQDLISIEIGNLLVHAEYGIGRFQGLKTLSVNNIPHDFIETLYAGSNKPYLPVENLETISRYGEEKQNVALDKLGGVAWQMRKAKLKERIKLAASALINTAAKRLTAQGHILESISENHQRFCDNFPYITTADQESAIEEIMEDFKSGQPMDRLLRADVGFGKTEVALRAAAAATLGLETVQVAVIVPTTLLARQHYITFSERFKNFPLRIKQLSKFTSRNEVSEVKEGLRNGKIDIIIGTHTLLVEGINFKNLGLLIIDEEQHFGVAQKEKLKNLKDNIHVSTLSATPIPRTLQMALVNLKSLSIITTPPINRKPVKTSVSPYDGLTIREALLKEKQRNGLSFYVTPRTNYLDELEEQLKKLVPELKVVKAHGSLVSSKLDQIMNDFYDHKFDILLSTSIIESGLDIMSANTMIVDRAYMFGLSQLYQMRRRVGRGEAQAYAYFLAPRITLLSPVAKKRLKTIQSLQALGSGFNIASHDMDNRGYGNLLWGDKQPGHIREVGIELYQKMLADTIAQMQENEEFEANREWSPILNLGVSVQISEDYIEGVIRILLKLAGTT
ncbi:MAG: Transcription-repair coupling factor (superfamily II helicase) [Candidatus Midichloria mitochondrii]|uniref:DEAD/DEAH box helicase n=1 Tax=Candidatus Midichloria mitochondrii TaxID=234827 RepID=UPI00069700C0|nr:DEAD/DEAH box helicase [Candidatus Midichloria mitochondrii]MDJ1256519.1 DEAD/DEAH box helicase [Candidatus Midichloria mitochondrii]MDJ1288234.1 DEAD/DEAH box helicase [Candidatus Midichloria mitochondrii]MDJ1299103.1 DEAD/DEAH box helicase [Candidatus Midichloria mitochondrii]MDJ1312838.1 DEAD/DEAH box helicase [Candidatus Midichloria mitochondrii]MDJ1583386.1 DEAD/DEAH box helicase [Candidatus Midichloria mitochondrii]